MKIIEQAVESDGMTYVGICAGAILACKQSLVSGISVYDEENFGYAHVRGTVSLDICKSQYAKILARHFAKNMYYHDGPALLVTSSNVSLLATYASAMCVARQDQEQVKPSFHEVAQNIIGKAAVTLSTRGKGKVLLIGPHPELGREMKNRTLVSLVAAVCEAEEDPPLKRRRSYIKREK